MEGKEFSLVRRYLGKNQKQMAQILCVSPKAVQSFEEGWRNVPVHAERQLLFLLALRTQAEKPVSNCWEIKKCPPERRATCTAWTCNAGRFCWFINGTFCQGNFQGTWKLKIQLCRQCEVFQSMIPSLIK
jgi:hypothetical protein